MKKIQIVLMAALLAAGAGYSALLYVDFESDTLGSKPTVAGAIVLPTTSTANNYVTVVDSSGNMAGTGKGVRLLDNSSNVVSGLEYNFVANTASQVSAVKASINFSCNSNSIFLNSMTIGIGAYDTSFSMTGNLFRWNEFHLRGDNTGRVALNGIADWENTFSFNQSGTANTLVMYVNDSTDSINYNEGGQDFALAADSVDYWLNSARVASLRLDDEVLATTGNLGKIGFKTSTNVFGVDYVIDNISVEVIPEPATALSLVLGGLIVTGYRRMRKSYGHF